MGPRQSLQRVLLHVPLTSEQVISSAHIAACLLTLRWCISLLRAGVEPESYHPIQSCLTAKRDLISSRGMKVVTGPHQLISFRSQRAPGPLWRSGPPVWALNWPGKLARPSLGQGESGVRSWQAGRRHAVGRQMARVLGQGAGRAEAGGQRLGAKDGSGPLPWREKLSSPGRGQRVVWQENGRFLLGQTGGGLGEVQGENQYTAAFRVCSRVT